MNPSKLTYPNQVAETAVESWLVNHIGHLKVDDSCWRIKWRGVFVRVSSGKSSWKTIGNAKSAFKNHIINERLAYWYERFLTGNDKLSYFDSKIENADFYKIIEPEIEYVQS